jgi:hypothetical protein
VVICARKAHGNDYIFRQAGRLHLRQGRRVLSHEYFAEQPHGFRVHKAVVRQNVRRAQMKVFAAHIGDRASRFANQKRSRGHVSGLQREFPEQDKTGTRVYDGGFQQMWNSGGFLAAIDTNAGVNDKC